MFVSDLNQLLKDKGVKVMSISDERIKAPEGVKPEDGPFRGVKVTLTNGAAFEFATKASSTPQDVLDPVVEAALAAWDMQEQAGAEIAARSGVEQDPRTGTQTDL